MAGGEGREGGANLGTDSVWDPHSRKRRYPWDPYDADGEGRASAKGMLTLATSLQSSCERFDMLH